MRDGEWWRIFTSAFFHLGPLHLAFNMYVLYLYGPIAERMYGPIEYLAIYLLCAAGGSVLTILVDPTQFAAGASGAIFGVIGLLFVVSRRHHAVLGGEARQMVAGIGSYLVFLLVFTFLVPGISWTGHLGGLIVGAILGFLLPPTGVETLGRHVAHADRRAVDRLHAPRRCGPRSTPAWPSRWSLAPIVAVGPFLG